MHHVAGGVLVAGESRDGSGHVMGFPIGESRDGSGHVMGFPIGHLSRPAHRLDHGDRGRVDALAEV